MPGHRCYSPLSLSLSLSDISFAVSVLARHLRNPLVGHLGAAKNLLRYIINTKDLGITYSRSESNTFEIEGYCDSDYANLFMSGKQEILTRRSVTGFVFLVNGAPISWQSKKQITVARSTDEAEYQAMATAASQALWLRKLLAEVHPPATKLQVFCDNQAALEHVKNPGSKNKTKHVDIQHQFVLDRITRQDLNFTWIPSEENTADMFTKALRRDSFVKLREKLGLKVIA